MTTKQAGKSSGAEEHPATDHREIEWQFDADDLEPAEGSLRKRREISEPLEDDRLTKGAKDLRSFVPDSKPFRFLTKGKAWKRFEKVLEEQNASHIPGKSVR